MLLTGTLMLSHQTGNPSQQQQQTFSQPSTTSTSSSNSTTNSTISSTVPHLTSNQQLSSNLYQESSNPNNINNGQNFYFQDAQPSPHQQAQINTVSHIVSSQGTNGTNKKYYSGQPVNKGSGSIHEDILIENNISEFHISW